MTTAQRRTKKAIKAILAANIKQSQLAGMIGASLNTVKSWTRKKNSLAISKDFELRIEFATGAKIQEDGRVLTNHHGTEMKKEGNRWAAVMTRFNTHFSRSTFERWRSNFEGSNKALVERYAERAANDAREVFLAAIEPDRGQISKLPSVWISFLNWRDDTLQHFNLSRQLDVIKKRKMDAKAVPLSEVFRKAGLFNPPVKIKPKV